MYNNHHVIKNGLLCIIYDPSVWSCLILHTKKGISHCHIVYISVYKLINIFLSSETIKYLFI